MERKGPPREGDGPRRCSLGKSRVKKESLEKIGKDFRGTPVARGSGAYRRIDGEEEDPDEDHRPEDAEEGEIGGLPAPFFGQAFVVLPVKEEGKAVSREVEKAHQGTGRRRGIGGRQAPRASEVGPASVEEDEEIDVEGEAHEEKDGGKIVGPTPGTVDEKEIGQAVEAQEGHHIHGVEIDVIGKADVIDISALVAAADEDEEEGQ